MGALWGSAFGMGEGEGEAVGRGKESWCMLSTGCWLVLQDVEAKTMRLEEHGKVVLVLERTSQGAGPSRPPTPGRNR